VKLAAHLLRFRAEDTMELAATATLTEVGDEYFLPLDAALLEALECKHGEPVEFTISGRLLIVTRHCDE
jgi:hypothetical protein